MLIQFGASKSSLMVVIKGQGSHGYKEMLEVVTKVAVHMRREKIAQGGQALVVISMTGSHE